MTTSRSRTSDGPAWRSPAAIVLSVLQAVSFRSFEKVAQLVESLSFEHVERTINETALHLFERYRSELLTNPPLYLVPVVWGEGTKDFTEPDAAQKDMHRVLAPWLEALTERFSQGAVDSKGISGTEYLLKGLVLYKMAYMVQYYLNCKGSGEDAVIQEEDPLLERVEPLGRA